MKTADREHIGYTPNSVWSILIRKPVYHAVPVAKNMISHFYGSRPLKPHWFKHLPF